MTTATTKNKEALARHSPNDWLLLVVFQILFLALVLNAFLFFFVFVFNLLERGERHRSSSSKMKTQNMVVLVVMRFRAVVRGGQRGSKFFYASIINVPRGRRRWGGNKQTHSHIQNNLKLLLLRSLIA